MDHDTVTSYPITMKYSCVNCSIIGESCDRQQDEAGSCGLCAALGQACHEWVTGNAKGPPEWYKDKETMTTYKASLKKKKGKTPLCVTCRLRTKRCDGTQDVDGACLVCKTQGLPCLGWEKPLPDWCYAPDGTRRDWMEFKSALKGKITRKEALDVIFRMDNPLSPRVAPNPMRPWYPPRRPARNQHALPEHSEANSQFTMNLDVIDPQEKGLAGGNPDYPRKSIHSFSESESEPESEPGRMEARIANRVISRRRKPRPIKFIPLFVNRSGHHAPLHLEPHRTSVTTAHKAAAAARALQ